MIRTFSICMLLMAVGSLLAISGDVAETPTMVSPPLIGATLPDAPMVAPDGSKTTLHEFSKDKKTVLVFYRGDW